MNRRSGYQADGFSRRGRSATARVRTSGNGRSATAAHIWCVAAAALLVLLAPCRSAQAYEQRPNTISLGIQGGGGFISGTGTYVVTDYDGTTQRRYPYDKLTGGGGLGIRLRYSLDPTHALGFSFEDLRFSRVSGQTAEVNQGAVDWLYTKQYQANNYMVDYYLYYGLGGEIGRRFKNCPYVSLSAGIHRDSFRLDKYDIVIPPVGFVGALGLGWEYFVRRPFALDLSARGYYFKASGGSAVATEVMLGFQYYLLR